jgi:hypothetical protein
MNIKKKSLLIGLLTTIVMANNYVLSMKNDNVIPDASYCIYDGDNATLCVGEIPSSSKFVIFYTFDGNPIITIEHKSRFDDIEKMLDPNSPKPQPTSCLIKYWQAISLGFWEKKGIPGWYIHFYDKNGYKIKSYRYSIDRNEITELDRSKERWAFHFDRFNPQSIETNFPLDLSKLSKENVKIKYPR